ncbi:MAG: hypothetical protein ABSE87_08820 [Terracidiphilus sp.]
MSLTLRMLPLQVAVWAGLGSMVALAQTPAPPAPPDATAPQSVERQSLPVQTAPAAPSASTAPVTVLEDTLIRVMTNEPVNNKRAEHGSPVLFTVSEDVLVGDVLAIPRGATVHGVVIKSKKAGVLTGSPELTLKLVSLVLGGHTYPLDSYQFKVQGTSKTGPTETKALRGAAVGAIVGAATGSVSAKSGASSDATGRAASMTAGAAVGAGVGTLVSAATPGPGIWIPSEAQVDFYLATPVTVTPVSAKEAARLAQGLHPGGPSLYVRGDTP